MHLNFLSWNHRPTGFFPGILFGREGGRIYSYANFFIVFGPNFRGGGGKLLQGAPPVEENQGLYHDFLRTSHGEKVGYYSNINISNCCTGRISCV